MKKRPIQIVADPVSLVTGTMEDPEIQDRARYKVVFLPNASSSANHWENTSSRLTIMAHFDSISQPRSVLNLEP